MATRLLINYAYGNWYASLSNSSYSYKFAGATAEDQIVHVRALRAAMKQGVTSVLQGASSYFASSELTDEFTPQQLVGQLFSAKEFVFEGMPIYDATEGSTLLDEIVEAGEAWGRWLAA